MFLGFNSFTKEIEMGTLTLLKSQGMHIWKWMIGKWMSLFLPILAICSISFFFTGLLLSNINGFEIFNWTSLFSLFLIYILYYIIFINLVLFISFKSKKSGIALVISLSIWVISCLLAPKVASNIAEAKYPYPTKQKFDAMVMKDKKNGFDGHKPWSKESGLLEKKVLK